MKIRYYLRMKHFTEEVRQHALAYHGKSNDTEVIEDGQRMLDLCNFIDNLCELIESGELRDDEV